MKIGVFDSGVGGLTVLKALREALPGHHYVYLGDTARVPYGIRSAEMIRKYALDDSRFLLEKNVEAIVVACNTASAHAADYLRDNLEIPVFDVLEAGVQAAHAASASGKTGLIATEGTVQSGAYARELKKLNPDTELLSRAAPLFPHLVEEGILSAEILNPIFDLYLQDFKSSEIDTLILGCTHYPILQNEIQSYLPGVTLVDSTGPLVSRLSEFEQQSNQLTLDVYVTDAPDRVQRIAERILGETVAIQKVSW